MRPFLSCSPKEKKTQLTHVPADFCIASAGSLITQMATYPACESPWSRYRMHTILSDWKIYKDIESSLSGPVKLPWIWESRIIPLNWQNVLMYAKDMYPKDISMKILPKISQQFVVCWSHGLGPGQTESSEKIPRSGGLRHSVLFCWEPRTQGGRSGNFCIGKPWKNNRKMVVAHGSLWDLLWELLLLHLGTSVVTSLIITFW